MKLSTVIVLSLALSAGACRNNTSANTQPDPSAGAVAEADAASPSTESLVDAAVEAVPDAAVAAQDAAPAPRSAFEVRLRAMATDVSLVRAAISPIRGLSLIRYEEAPPSGRGREVHASEQLCGATMDRRAEEVRALIAAAVRRADEGQDMLCGETACTVPGMEYEPAKRFHFATVGDAGAPSLIAIEVVSEATMGDAWMQRVRAHVDRAMQQHGSHACPARR